MQTNNVMIAGKSVPLATVFKLLGTLPTIEVKVEELAIATEGVSHTTMKGEDARYARRSKLMEEENERPSVFLSEGKYLIVTGRKSVMQAIDAKKPIIKAKLISKQALKHMQTVAAPAAPAPVQEERQPYYQDRSRQDGPFNAPRFNERNNERNDQRSADRPQYPRGQTPHFQHRDDAGYQPAHRRTATAATALQGDRGRRSE